MRRHDVFRNPDGPGYLLVLQSELLAGLNTVVVAPLWPAEDAPAPAQRLNPIFEIEGVKCVLLTQYMAAIPRSVCKDFIGAMAHRAGEIMNAVDMVIGGF